MHEFPRLFLKQFNSLEAVGLNSRFFDNRVFTADIPRIPLRSAVAEATAAAATISLSHFFGSIFFFSDDYCSRPRASDRTTRPRVKRIFFPLAAAYRNDDTRLLRGQIPGLRPRKSPAIFAIRE